jgi:hypothetical protein
MIYLQFTIENDQNVCMVYIGTNECTLWTLINSFGFHLSVTTDNGKSYKIHILY